MRNDIARDHVTTIQEALEKYEWLARVKDYGRITLVCTRCNEALWIEETTTETSDLYVYAEDEGEDREAFSQGKPGIEDGVLRVRCRCVCQPEVDEPEIQTYAIAFEERY